MKQLQTIALAVVLAVSTSGCLDEHLNTEPPDILTDETLWASPDLILGVIANFYSRLPDFMTFPDGGDVPNPFPQFDEGLFSGNSQSGDASSNQITQYATSLGAAWNAHYNLIRDIHVAMDGIEASTSALVTPALKAQLDAELRFLRAWVYFDLVRRMGGVPILTEQALYDFSGDPTYLQQPRATEAAVYDFIATEMDAIAPLLGNAGSKSRAHRFAALALKSRAMLYAGSIARREGVVAGLSTTGGEVGIPASRANEYFQKSLDASKAIIESGAYSLYNANPDAGANFYQALTVKGGNPETIWVKDYSVSGARVHIWTLSIVPPTLRLDALGGNNGATISVSAQLGETFDYLDGSAGTFRGVGTGSNTAAGQAGWIFYDQPQDIFAGKDGRFHGTILYPGSSARGGNVEIQAGVYAWNAAAGKYDRSVGGAGSRFSDGGLMTGRDGPIPVQSHVGATGLYPRKFLDPAPAGASAATRSDIAWIRFRLGEIYMNAAEAAFELGMTTEALNYINALRQRAGFPANSLTSLTFDKIVKERWAELAFEEHRFFDLKRWRLAHLLWDGSASSTTANLQYLWGFRVVHPGSPNDGKFVYDRAPSPRQTRPRNWQVGNYYSEIPGGALTNNPTLVPNPFH
jgi:hypothetical protein